MACPNCSGETRETDRYCPNCGVTLSVKPDQPTEQPTEQPKVESSPLSGFGVFGITLLGSLALTAILSWVFHFPIFILAGFLPLLWQRRGQ